ncbi:MAG TPA: hypothetical protein VF285_07845 [Castellaniella sp.]|uniref:hypothetical protein n=1 Tax=Castellaniella sp. TaxID=1955812 RepID=UPI002EDC6C5D
MPWRLIFVFLLLAAGASAWGGLQLGDWLIAHGPTQIQRDEAVRPELVHKTPILDANGKPFVASAPQPLADGRLGVPQLPAPTDWHLQPESLLSENRPIALATTTISMDQAIAAAQQQMNSTGGNGLQGIANVGNLGSQAVQPVDVTVPPPPPPPQQTTLAQNDPNWQKAFHAELKACENVGFFSRPTCAWAARNKYCEPHNAWGKVADCPAKKQNF